MGVLANIAIGIHMLWSRLKVRAPFIRALKSVEKTQADVLMRILRDNKKTEFGKKYGLSEISSVSEFRNQVPIHDYDDLEPYIKRQQEGHRSLTTEAPVYYARTSGTTGSYKDIPLTESGITQIKHFQKQLAYSLWSQTDFFKGTILGFSSPRFEGKLPNGIPYGSTSGAIYDSLSSLFKKKLAIPSEAYDLSNVESKYEVYALSALAHDSVTGVSSVNPSSLLKVCTLIEENAEALISLLLRNDQSNKNDKFDSIVSLLRSRMSSERVKLLGHCLNSGEILSPKMLWPRLSTLVTWTGGSCGIALNKLKKYLPSTVKIVEMGYVSSEFSGTANIDTKRNICMPLVTDHFYEFVEKDKWLEDSPEFLSLHELEIGKDYYIFVTTQSGLYRYDINDIVRVSEGLKGCPRLDFVRKGKGVINITGEKISEDQVIAAVSLGLESIGHVADALLVLADVSAGHYRIFVEVPQEVPIKSLSKKIEDELRKRNIEYNDKRASGRLSPLTVERFLKGAGQAIKDNFLAKGVRETQYKPPVLAYWNEWSDWIGDWIERSAP